MMRTKKNHQTKNQSGERTQTLVQVVHLTGCHFTEDFKGLRVGGLDGVDPAGGLSSQEQLVTIRGRF